MTEEASSVELVPFDIMLVVRNEKEFSEKPSLLIEFNDNFLKTVVVGE